MNAVISILLFIASPCTAIRLAPDPFTYGGNRIDAPEHIRGLHAVGDSAGSPIRIRIAGQPDRVFYLWALDTELDGDEHYDRLAVSTRDDVGDMPDQLIPIAAQIPQFIPALPRALPQLRIIVPAFDGDIRRLSICVDPHA